MAFIAVIDVGLDAKLLEHQNAAHTEEILLFDTVLPIPAIKLVSDRAVVFAVHIEVGVEKIQFHAAHVDAPNMGIDGASGIRH